MAFIGVPGRDTVDAMQAFVDEFELGHVPHAVDEDGSLWARFGVSYQPAWVFVSADGAVDTVPSALGEERLTARLRQLTSG